MKKYLIKNFGNLSQEQLQKITDTHYNYWVKFNPKLDKKTTENKFKNIYTNNEIPFGIALLENDEIIGFCVLKKLNLKKYPDIFPWISDVFIFEEHRNKKAGSFLIKSAENILKKLGFNFCYIWTDVAPLFYEKLGYKFIQEIEKKEGGKGMLFKKNLIRKAF